jgi:hypothetical protein
MEEKMMGRASCFAEKLSRKKVPRSSMEVEVERGVRINRGDPGAGEYASIPTPESAAGCEMRGAFMLASTI